MIISKTVVMNVCEFEPTYRKRKVRDVIEEYQSRGEMFCLYASLEENDLDAVLYNIYSMGEGMQGELAIFSFEDNQLYQSVDNTYPRDAYLDLVTDIFTEKQFHEAKVNITDGIPGTRGTGYLEKVNQH